MNGNQIQKDNNHANIEILEQGDIYFFYRPKKNSQEVKGIEDVRRFFMVTSSETDRSEEHTSELQSRQYIVCRLLLEKKKTINHRVIFILTLKHMYNKC